MARFNRRIAPLTASGAMLAALCASAANAQDQQGGNQAWLGQVGGTNIITIDQRGRDNAAGADNVNLLINQNGDNNRLEIGQTGFQNRVGATEFGTNPRGVNQIGSWNFVEIVQDNLNPPDGDNRANTVGAVTQRSALLFAGGDEGGDGSRAANAFLVIQRGTDAGGADAGPGGHYIGRIIQVQQALSGAANLANLTQTGGGQDAGNSLGVFLQSGSGNALTMLQDGQRNVFSALVQAGIDNSMYAEQNGNSNQIEFGFQFGVGNDMVFDVTGDGNVLQRFLQNNQLQGALAERNMMEVTIVGDANGVIGFTSDAAANIGAAQSDLVQLGEGNTLRFTINGGDQNSFGFFQDGTGNDVIAAIGPTKSAQSQADVASVRSTLNEVAVFQNGTSNRVYQIVIGNENVAAIRQVGDENRIYVDQNGDGNTVRASVEANRSNVAGAFFRGAAALIAQGFGDAEFQPGRLTQSGNRNSINIDVLGGSSDNDFAANQNGDGHVINASISGQANQLAVVQSGIGNTSLSVQSGSGNSLGVRQF
jgi:hypothetical protein